MAKSCLHRILKWDRRLLVAVLCIQTVAVFVTLYVVYNEKNNAYLYDSLVAGNSWLRSLAALEKLRRSNIDNHPQNVSAVREALGVVWVDVLNSVFTQINCSNSHDFNKFWNTSRTFLPSLVERNEFKSFIGVNNSSDSRTIANKFVEKVCKKGTKLTVKQNNEMLDAVADIYRPGPSAIPRPETAKYYLSIQDNEVFPLRCSTCAVVSSSGRILGSTAGKDIDSHACILRMNNAPTRGFEVDVGSRTTVRLVPFVFVEHGLNTGHKIFFTEDEMTEYVLFGGLDGKASLVKKLTDFLKREHPLPNIYYQQIQGEIIHDKDFAAMIGHNREESKTWLSTGWFTLELALNVCDKIHIYGMVPADYCSQPTKKRAKFNYYQTEKNPEECKMYNNMESSKKFTQRLITEKTAFAKWRKDYNISFHYPSWNIDIE